tara:strand:+ start:1231 stop:1617 length:387 start_codon:yes stop_codon:yes gene_type:complete
MKKKTAPATKRDGRLFVGDHAAMFVPYGSAFFIQADIPSDEDGTEDRTQARVVVSSGDAGVAVQTPAPEFVVSAIARAVKDGEHAYHLGQINNDTLTDLRGQQLAFQRQQSLDGKETIGAVQAPEEAE